MHIPPNTVLLAHSHGQNGLFARCCRGENVGLKRVPKLCGTFYILTKTMCGIFLDLLFSAIVTSKMTLGNDGFGENCTVSHPVITINGPLSLALL
jgi:hypothetical protein